MSERPLRFAWLPQGLPGGPWPEELRAAVCAVMQQVGWPAVQQGERTMLEALYRDFTMLFPRFLIDRSDVDRAADLYTLVHILLWRGTQNLTELKRFNTDVVVPFAHYLAQHFPKQPPRPATEGVPRIAVLSETSDLFSTNAVAKTTVSLMLGQHEIRDPGDWPFLYCIKQPVQNLWDFAAETGLRVRDLSRPTPSQMTEAIVAQLEADAIDILIADSNCAVATMVLQQRPCRVQAFHENGFAPWAIPELDLAFLGITKPSEGLFDARVAMHETPRNTAAVFHRAARPQEQVDALRAVLCAGSGVPQPSVIYGFYGRMAKITPDYMAIVEAILARDPQAIFFAGGTGSIAMIVERRSASPVGDRIILYDEFIDGHLVSEAIDVFLDTFPFPGGNACLEAQAHGVPVVWMTPAPDSEMQLVLTLRDEQLKARDAAQFVDLSLQLVEAERRRDRGQFAQALAARYGDMTAQATLVEQHLRAAWAEALDQ
ncbi:hypothetical protein [uncultured Sphingomonas sp.]|uniref:hypothetical protein n=1 Tax=uncultured Sphingomonas sp. TaxID=158754 RepID=UPI0025EFC61A|nr:hypothetical protein [uncultured Sphingomonas sp.]